MLAFFLQGAALGLSAALSPGPFQSLVIAESLLGGLKRAAPVIFAPLLADIPIAFTMIFVLNQAPEAFLQLVRLAGAALLLYLAWSLWQELRARQTEEPEVPVPASTARRGFLRGMAMLFLSPGTYLYWSLILGPLLLEALGQSWGHPIAFVVSFYLFSIGGLLVIAAILGRAREISPQVKRGLQVASLLLLVLIAGLLIATAF